MKVNLGWRRGKREEPQHARQKFCPSYGSWAGSRTGADSDQSEQAAGVSHTGSLLSALAPQVPQSVPIHNPVLIDLILPARPKPAVFTVVLPFHSGLELVHCAALSVHPFGTFAIPAAASCCCWLAAVHSPPNRQLRSWGSWHAHAQSRWGSLFFMLYLFCANRPLICMPPKTKMYYKSALKRIPIQQHVKPVDLLVGQALKNTQTGRPYLRSGIAKRCLPWHQAEYWRIRGTPRDA